MMSIVALSPLSNRCLVMRLLPQAVTKGGIHLTRGTLEKSARLGKVISCGTGQVNDEGKFIKSIVKAGDVVLLPEFTGTKVEMEDEKNEYMIYRDYELLGLVGKYKH